MSRRPDNAGARITLLMRALAGDLSRAWTVAEMGAVLGVSDGQLRRLCAAAVGATPRQLLCNMRLQAAARLLRDPAMRIKEVQARVGVADASHFCRDFRDRFGMSPTEYRCQNADRTDSRDRVV